MNLLNRFREKNLFQTISKIQKIKRDLENIVSMVSILPSKLEYFSNQHLYAFQPGFIDSFLIELKAKRNSILLSQQQLEWLCYGFTREKKKPEDKSFEVMDFPKNFNEFKISPDFISMEIKKPKIEKLIREKRWNDIYQELNSILNYYLFKIDQIEYYLSNLNYPSSELPRIEYRKTRLIPRSIPRTIERFFDEIKLTAEDRYLQEFRFSRQQIWISFRSVILFFFLPIILTQLLKGIFLEPLVSYTWNKYNTNLFLNAQQEKKALHDLKDYEDQLYFEQLVQFLDTSHGLIGKTGKQEKSNNYFNSDWDSLNNEPSQNTDKFWDPLSLKNEINLKNSDTGFYTQMTSVSLEDRISTKIEPEMLIIARKYNQQSINLLLNLFGDFCTITIFFILIKIFRKEVTILKAFFGEILYSLGDTTKSFLIILLTDLLVGFHSPKGWEIFIQFLLDHFAIPQNEDFVFLCVATLPVLLDTAFKYWIFRYLNRLSPSTVVTYHKMIE